MIERLKIDGIYDERSLQVLEGSGIQDIGLDFRPKSLNFIQGYRFLELMNHSFSLENRYFLHFCNEKDYMIKKTLDDISALGLGSRENFFLEFSDYNDSSFYDQFQTPYFWHYKSDANPKELIRNSIYLKGIIFPYTLFDEYAGSGTSFSFAQAVLQLLNLRKGGAGLELVFSFDWDLKIFPSIYDMFDFEIVSFPVNRKVEVCYRNLNSTKLKDNISKVRRSLIMDA